MKKFGIIILLINLCLIPLQAIHVSNGKILIKENQKRAQLSLILQIRDSDIVPDGMRYEAALLTIIKDSLKEVIIKQRGLKYHRRFTHIFVTAIDNNTEEDVLAMFSKTPDERYPSIHIFKKKTRMPDLVQVEGEKAAPVSMFDQLQNQQ